MAVVVDENFGGGGGSHFGGEISSSSFRLGVEFGWFVIERRGDVEGWWWVDKGAMGEGC